MSLPKLIGMKIYQAVKFQGTMETFFTPNRSKKMKDLELVPNDIGVEIKTEKDWIIVPYANIAAMYPEGNKAVEAEKKNIFLNRVDSKVEEAQLKAKTESERVAKETKDKIAAGVKKKSKKSGE